MSYIEEPDFIKTEMLHSILVPQSMSGQSSSSTLLVQTIPKFAPSGDIIGNNPIIPEKETVKPQQICNNFEQRTTS